MISMLQHPFIMSMASATARTVNFVVLLQFYSQLAPGWAKGWYRQGIALSIMERHSQAAAAFTRALELEPSSKVLRSL